MRVITLLGKGGGGKTTTTINLATIAAHRFKVGIVDTDPQSSLCHWRAVRGPSDIKVVAATTESRFNEVLCSARNARLDLLFVDTSPALGAPTLAAARAADVVMVIARPSLFDLLVTQRRIEALRSINAPHCIVLNATPPLRANLEAPLVRNARKTLAGNRIWRGQITRRHIVVEAAAIGKGVVECEPECSASNEYLHLWHDIARVVGVGK